MLTALLAGCALANLAALALLGWDKRRARRGSRRVPEAVLHALELVGGWPGALLGMRWFRHKTHKRAYRRVTFAIIALHAAALLLLLWLLVPGRG